MRNSRPEYVEPYWCCDCHEEMRFVGINPSGYAQFFCDGCTYRRDRHDGKDVLERYLSDKHVE